MIRPRKGNAPTIAKSPYAGEIVTDDHIIAVIFVAFALFG